jgi:hypothetical protein
MLVNLHRIVDTAIHYMVSPTQPFPQIEQLIAQENYFVIHAPRQTGKSTAMLALAQQLTASDRYTSMMVSVEVGSPFSNDIHKAEVAILGCKTAAKSPSACDFTLGDLVNCQDGRMVWL